MVDGKIRLTDITEVKNWFYFGFKIGFQIKQFTYSGYVRRYSINDDEKCEIKHITYFVMEFENPDDLTGMKPFQSPLIFIILLLNCFLHTLL